jgi:hypothetical protein
MLNAVLLYMYNTANAEFKETEEMKEMKMPLKNTSEAC